MSVIGTFSQNTFQDNRMRASCCLLGTESKPQYGYWEWSTKIQLQILFLDLTLYKVLIRDHYVVHICCETGQMRVNVGKAMHPANKQTDRQWIFNIRFNKTNSNGVTPTPWMILIICNRFEIKLFYYYFLWLKLKLLKYIMD